MFYKTWLLRNLKYLITQSSLDNNDRGLPALLEPYHLFYNFYAYYKIAFIAVLLCFGTWESLESSRAQVASTLHPSSRGSGGVLPLFCSQILCYCSWQKWKSYMLFTLGVKTLRAACSFPTFTKLQASSGITQRGKRSVEKYECVDYNLA